MAPRPPRHGRRHLPQLAQSGSLVVEDLPSGLVYYPGPQGAFFGFAYSRAHQPVLCGCAEEAVRNLFRLSPPADMQPSDYALFPDVIARGLVGQADPMAGLRFRPCLCHRCNQTAPTLRYCHPAAGQKFVQTYGWYINQTFLRLGIHPVSHQYLPDRCPPEFLGMLEQVRALRDRAREVRAGLAALMNGPRREIPREQRTHWPNVTAEELAPLAEIEHQLGRPRRELWNAVQNITRAEFGLRPVGEAWTSENQLYRIVCRLFPGEKVIRRYRPDWMEGLELDLYLPGLKLALEYQGEQHFHPIRAWGGQQGLLERKARDARKVELCRAAGVRLITVHYAEPLTEEYIRERTGCGHPVHEVT